MNRETHIFSGKTVHYYFDASLAELQTVASKNNSIIITDDNVAKLYQQQLDGWRQIVIPSGEVHKVQSTVDTVIQKLMELGADRSTLIIGCGGGVVTDITGYAASIFMRGLRFAYVPTTLLCMVDASIGGKSGIDVGQYKNMVGVIRQPEFIFFDTGFLDTLPDAEWSNGFAEIIKHACIKDAAMFGLLEKTEAETLKADRNILNDLIRRNVGIKSVIVEKDELENGERRLLNYGHTIGHAIENLCKIPHGHAVSIGMVWEAAIAEAIDGSDPVNRERLAVLLNKYGLPATILADHSQLIKLMRMDKKKEQDSIHFVLLKEIGKAVVKPVGISQLEQLTKQFA